MKKTGFRALCLLLLLLMLYLPVRGERFALGEPWQVDLSPMIQNEKYREYAEMMLDHYLRNDTAVQQALSEGYCALFFFDGCSDNMDDPELADLTYYRVTGVCIGVKLDDTGEPCILYFNESASTIPDRPLEYGAWSLAKYGQVGPATICDGTYEIYSVKHMGKYEALHMRDSGEDDRLEAVYMMSEGFVTSQADMINIHTRTSNHTSGIGMWSAGCMLVGDGDFREFEELMASTYYTVYDDFDIGRRVGTVTIDRMLLRDAMLELYGSTLAVDTVLLQSRCAQPEIYRKQCTGYEGFAAGVQMQTAQSVSIMSLPCSNASDARSRVQTTLGRGEILTLTGKLENPQGQLWYELEYAGGTAYVPARSMELVSQSWFSRIWGILFS